MTNLKLSRKLHLFIIISVAITVIAVAVGIICQFLAGGYFNYGNEFSDCKAVEVNYAYVDFADEDEVISISDGIFDKAGMSYFSSSYGDTDDGGRIIFRFSESTDADKLLACANDITAALANKSENSQSNASYHFYETELNGGRVLVFASIAISSAVVLQFLYYFVRYKAASAFAVLLADVHNLALYVSLLTLTRIPVGISAVAFGVLTVLLTMIASGYLFDRYRRNMRKESFVKLDGDDRTDLCVNESFKTVVIPLCALAGIVCIFFVMWLCAGATSVMTALSPVVLTVIAIVSAVYGTFMFTPPVFTRIGRLCDKLKARSKNKK